jgi:hypothetical protein
MKICEIPGIIEESNNVTKFISKKDCITPVIHATDVHILLENLYMQINYIQNNQYFIQQIINPIHKLKKTIENEMKKIANQSSDFEGEKK